MAHGMTASCSAPALTTPVPSSSVASSTVAQVQQWCSTLREYSMRLDHVAMDIQTDRVIYHMECELQDPIPSSYLRHFEFISLGYPLGGLWKIYKVGRDNRFLELVSWRKTELKHEQIEVMNAELLAKQQTPDAPLVIFNWKMHLGTLKNRSHWFLRSAAPSSLPPPTNIPVQAKLLAGFAPIEAYLTINSITALDTVAQTFTADVTWEVTLPAITAIWEDSVLRELLDIFQFNEDEFGFANVTSVYDEKAITTVLAYAGTVEVKDDPLLLEPVSEPLGDLKFSRRTIAVFTEEMSLYNFPYDQQKLNFAFSMGNGVRASLPISPAPVESGKFTREYFKLGNVFNVVYDDKVFIGAVYDTPTKKSIEFEVMLERRSRYYFTNVAFPAAIITYLCFTTFAPLDDSGSLMDTSSRLQIVITLLLTAVTFKSQVASLIPQVSYFTSLDKYVFFCFLITCLVTLENSLFPSLVKLFPEWNEDGLLGFSVGLFTLINVVWMVYLVIWIRARAHKSKVLLQVEEYVRVVSATIPAGHRLEVIREYLSELAFKEWELPVISCTDAGFLFVELPEESPQEIKNNRFKRPKESRAFRKQAQRALPDIRRVYCKVDPSAAPATESPEICIERVDVKASIANVLARRFPGHGESDAIPLRQTSLHNRCKSKPSEPATASGGWRSFIGTQSSRVI